MALVDVLSHKAAWLATRLLQEQAQYPGWTGTPYPEGDMAMVIQSLFIGNAINFTLWKASSADRFTFGKFKGHQAVWMALRTFPELLDTTALRELESHPMIEQMPLPSERYAALREAGRVLAERYGGNAINLCLQADWKAKNMVARITSEFPMWSDTCRGVDFNKRAQLFVAMVHGRFQKSAPVAGIETLSVLCDYHIPRMLRAYGVLAYAPGLSTAIDTDQLLEKESDAEFEIRHCALEASRLIEREMACMGRPFTALQLDYVLWRASRELETGKHHLTVTTAY